MARIIKKPNNNDVLRKIVPIGVALAIVIVIVVFSLLQSRNAIQNIDKVAYQMAKHLSGDIGNVIDYAKSSIKSVSVSISQTMTSDEIENPSEVISPMVENTPFGGIEYIREDGMNVMNIGEPFDASDRVYYIEGIKGNSGIWNNYHPKTSQENLINFYTPLIYNGDISGVVTGYLGATTQVATHFEKELYDEEIIGMLFDEDGMLICSTIDAEFVKDCTVESFLNNFELNQKQKESVIEKLNNEAEGTFPYSEIRGKGRISISIIPDTNWKVAYFVPASSFKNIIGMEIRNAIVATSIVILLLVIYFVLALLNSSRKNKEIIGEIAEIRDIVESANMGIWKIELFDNQKPKMYVDEEMKKLLGTMGEDRTPEETYEDWFSNVMPEALESVLKSVGIMQQECFDENTYKWKHPKKGVRYVRCGGTGIKTKDGFLLRGYHYDVDEVVRREKSQLLKLKTAMEEKKEYYATLGTLGSIFYSLHVIDLKEDTSVEFTAQNEVKDIVNHRNGAREMMRQVMNAVNTEDYIEGALEFSDLTTIADRMKDKLIISKQFVGNRIGWYLASFITMEKDEDGKPTKVLFTTRVIDEEKKQEEKLIKKTQTDEMTGVFNRRAYEESIYAHNDIPEEDEFIFISIDVNGLKIVNDTNGHMAGDELIIGACQCMKKTLGKYGNIYRTGGDEFIAILFCDETKLAEVLAEFDKTVNNWSGKLIDSLSVSYGWISKNEEPGLSVRQLGSIADKRMYEAKSAHYRKKGIDRRGQQDAHRALCELYTKILKINLTEDSYLVVNMNPDEQTKDKGFDDKISEWLSQFGKLGQVHPDDLEKYLEYTSLDYLKKYFAEEKTSLQIFYRRKYEDGFKQVMMEMIPANDYSKDNQSLYLYVKDIDK